MCLNPIRLYNPARKINLNGGQRFQIDIPCGQCAECREAKRTDIYFRSYYECEYTWSKNGYVYFDTLTYSTPNLPHVRDFVDKVPESMNFSCFNREDFRLFMVRLRRQLQYHGLDLKNQLKYFVASEYGSDKEYVDDNGVLRKGTNRPHYHVLFFVTGDVDPVTFSKYVNKCWQKGKTDGIDYHDLNYLMEHVYGPQYNNDKVHMRAVCNYVAKYVLKDSEFEETLQKRMQAVFGEDYKSEYHDKRRYDKIEKCMKPYTKWSNGFGLYGLHYNSDEDMYNNKMRVPDKNKVWRFAPLSGYLNRKKYYEHVYDSKGRLYWRLTPEGKRRAFEHNMQGAEQFAERMEEWLSNLDILMKKSDDNSITSKQIFEFQKNIKNKVEKYLNGRSFLEFAVYCFFYKGRVKSKAQLFRERLGYKYVDTPDEFFYKGLMSANEIDELPEEDILYNYSHHRCRHKFGERLVSPIDLGNTKDGFIYPGFEYGYDSLSNVAHGKFTEQWNRGNYIKVTTAEEWAKYNVINENTDPRFTDFDKLYNLYCSSLYYYNKRKQDTYDYIEDMKKRLKNLYRTTI